MGIQRRLILEIIFQRQPKSEKEISEMCFYGKGRLNDNLSRKQEMLRWLILEIMFQKQPNSEKENSEMCYYGKRRFKDNLSRKQEMLRWLILEICFKNSLSRKTKFQRCVIWEIEISKMPFSTILISKLTFFQKQEMIR